GAAAERLRTHLAERPAPLGALAASLAGGRAALAERACLVASTPDELDGALGALAAGRPGPRTARGRAGPARARVAFLVPGQGAGAAGALAGLLDEEPVARTLAALAEPLGPLERLPLAALLEPGPDSEAALARTEHAQPALYALALALGAWWAAHGVEPDAVLGHSVGAYAAAALAGALDPQAGARLVAARGRLMGALPDGGAMAALAAPRERVERALGALGAPGLAIAAENAPEETVVAGPAAALEALCAQLGASGVRARRLAVSHAFHSPLVEPALAALAGELGRAGLRAPSGTLVSDHSGALAGAELATPGYWLEHARAPVRFAAALRTLGELGADCLVELGPGQTLLGLARRTLGAGPAALASLRPGEPGPLSLRRALAGAWCRGAALDWAAAAPPAGPALELPTYPFERRRHWLPEGGAPRAGGPGRGPAHGEGLRPEPVATPLAAAIYASELCPARLGLLREHRVYGLVVVPGVAYLELILAAAERDGAERPAVSALELVAPLVLGDEEARAVQVIVTDAGDGTRAAELHGQEPGGGWRLHARARVTPLSPDRPAEPVALERLREHCGAALGGEEFYASIWHPDFELGDSFRLIEQVHRGETEALALLRVPDGATGVRPELLVLDACVQTLVAPAGAHVDHQLPVALGTGHGRIEVHGPLGGERLWCWARLDGASGAAGEIAGEVRILDEAGTPLAEVDGLRFRRVGRETLKRLAADPAADAPDARSTRHPAAPDRAQLAAADGPARREALGRYLATVLGAVVGMSAEELDPAQPLTVLADSLMIAELKLRVETDFDVEVPIERFFDDAGLDDLAAWLADEALAEPAPEPARTNGHRRAPAAMTVEQLTAAAELDPAIRPAAPADPRSAADPRAVLLTGATGFVGAFLLAELLERTTADVLCLVRADTPAEGEERIRANLLRHCLDDHAAGRIVPVLGDLTQPRLGLSDSAFKGLAASADAVYHCGAVVKWTYPYSALAPPNVDGTREMLRLATAARTLPFHFVSTVGVFSSLEYDRASVAEDEPLERSGPLTVGYAQTKWVAERMATAARERGVPVSIHRPNVGAHSATGAFNPQDHICLALKGCIELGAAPESSVPVQMAPVDFVAAALVDRALACDHRTFHLVNPEPIRWTALFQLVRELGYPLATMSFEDWAERVGRTAGSLGALASGPLQQAALPRFDCAQTLAALPPERRRCPRIDLDLLRTYFARFAETGFVETPPRGGLIEGDRHKSPHPAVAAAGTDQGARGHPGPVAGTAPANDRERGEEHGYS
ncbi:MAG TPA: thioester reductase domain-containing protein, partial [Thermoleophilaceae bacterium]